MAITRKMLKAMGIEEEKIDQIIEAHTEVTDALKAERDKYKGEAENATSLQKKLDEANETIKNGTSDEYKVKYDALKEEFTSYKNDVEAKETKKTKTAAYEQLLKDAGISDKRINAVLKVSNVDNIEFNEDGTVKGADAMIEAIKNEWSDFIQAPGLQGSNPANPPQNNNSNIDLGTLSMEEYIKARTTNS